MCYVHNQWYEISCAILYNQNASSGSRLAPDGRTDMTKLIAACRNFANAPKNDSE